MVLIPAHDALHHDIHNSHLLPGTAMHCNRPLHGKGWEIARRYGFMFHTLHIIKLETEQSRKKLLTICIALVLLLGCLSVIPNELILKEDRNGMNIVVLSMYLFAIVSSLVQGGRNIFFARKIPIRYHILLVAAAYGYNTLQGVAFSMGLPMALALVLKNGGLLFQMMVGAAILKQSYSIQQVAAAALLTFGIVVTVLSKSNPKAKVETDIDSNLATSIVPGVALMLAAMLVRALGNSTSSIAFEKYGKQYHEVMFYQHAIGLPLLLRNWPELLSQLQEWSSMSTVPVFGVAVPLLFAYLIVTFVCNYFVTLSCARVVALGGPVLLNFVLVLQRFVSIVISATIFNAPPYPPMLMWVGASMVVAGCVLYIAATASSDAVTPSTLSKETCVSKKSSLKLQLSALKNLKKSSPAIASPTAHHRW